MNTIQETVAKLLGNRDKLTSKQCEENIQQISERLEEIRSRTADISSQPTGRGKLGPERERIAETGSPQDLIKLDTEEQLLEAEDSSLCYQRVALRKRQETALIEEAPGLAKSAIKRLGPALKAAETASAVHIKATAALEAVKDEITAARRTANQGGIKAPAVKTDDFTRLAELLGWHYTPSHIVHEDNMRLALKTRRLELTDWQPEQLEQPETDAQWFDRHRQDELRQKRGAYLNEPRVPEVAGE